jgi:hypothetical protein
MRIEDEEGLEPNEDVVGLLEKASMPRRRWFAGQPQRLLRRDDETSTTVGDCSQTRTTSGYPHVAKPPSARHGK